MPGGLPVVGHALALQRDPLGLLTRGRERFGDVFEITALGRRFVVLAGREAHEAYFRAPDDQLSQKEVYQFTVPIFGRGVAYDALPDRMAEQVGFLYPAVRESRMQSYARQMYEEIDSCVRGWGEEGVVDLARATNEMTVNIACRCLLGPEIRAQLYDGFDKLYHELQGGISMLGFFFPGLPTPRHLRRDRARRKVGRLIASILAERRRSRAEEADFMQVLMEARYKSGEPLSDHDIAGILITALFAGQHTSGVLAAWVGLELANDPACVPAIREELARVYGGGREMSFASLRDQKVLERAVRESERLHPPLIILVRRVLRSFAYKDYVVPAGDMVMVSPLLSHRLAEVFPHPDSFDPERWIGPDGEDRVAPHTLITFGGGKHVCIGAHFAYMQIKAIWSVLLSRFEFSLVDSMPAPDYGAWVTGPRSPSRVSYRRRPGAEAVL